jgi:glutathione-regulated potassium-efflux system ancillary protein KefG
MQQNILIVFAHPRLEHSRNHSLLLKHIPKRPEITLHDLYEEYPYFNIDVKKEKELLAAHQFLIWQHPFYWYSIPPLLKQWIDMVLEFGWAYGPNGTALQGKKVMNVITAGGSAEAYTPGGRNRFTITDFLLPLHQTVHLCGMEFLPPFVIYGTHRLSFEELEKLCNDYYLLLELLLQGDYNTVEMKQFSLMNEWLQTKQ